MAKKSSEKKFSKGGRKEAKKRQYEKRIEKFEKRRAEGKTYQYKPNPFKKGTHEYDIEAYARSKKETHSKKTPYSQWISILAKLNNELELEKAEKAKKKFASKFSKAAERVLISN